MLNKKLLNSVRRITLLTVGIFLSMLFAASFMGPGVKDYSYHLVNGYRYSDAGAGQTDIVRTGKGIVIDARVDEYFVDGHIIYVAQRPMIYEDISGKVISPISKLSDFCVYWKINTKTHEIKEIERISTKVRCNLSY